MPPSVKATYLKKMHKFVGKGFMKKVLLSLKKKKAEIAVKEGTAAGAAAAPLALTDGADEVAVEVPVEVSTLPVPPPPMSEVALAEKVRIWSDAYGKQCFGAVGRVKSFVGANVVVETDTCRSFTVAATAVEAIDTLKEPLVAKNLKHITGDLRQKWLVECGWSLELKAGEDIFAAWKKPLAGQDAVCLDATHLQLYLLFMKWSLSLDNAVAFVDPVLLYIWSEQEEEDAALAASRWSCIEKTCVQHSEALVLLPILQGGHWVLMVVDVKQKECRYYDSLAVEAESCYLRADFILEHLKKIAGMEWLPTSMPHRCNDVKQGPLECGFFVTWWMEEECRRRLGEGIWSRGCPRPGDVRKNIYKLLCNLEPAAEKMQKDLKLLFAAAEAALKKDSGVASSSAAAATVELKRLEDLAKADFAAGVKGEAVDICIDVSETLGPEHWAEQVMELLLPSHLEDVQRVRATMPGICSSCRWSSGCHRCCWWKTVRYWRRVETKGHFMEGYSEPVMAKAKAKLSKAKGGGMVSEASVMLFAGCFEVPK